MLLLVPLAAVLGAAGGAQAVRGRAAHLRGDKVGGGGGVGSRGRSVSGLVQVVTRRGQRLGFDADVVAGVDGQTGT